MSQNDSEDSDLRRSAEMLINQTRIMQASSRPTAYDMSRTHSINLITEEFLGGYMQDGRMSVVRRFFCLFVTFDLFFVSLLWLICIMITGDNIFQALQKQIVHYTIYKSLFDVVAAAICRFIVLIFFYALLYINHWFIIAFSTSASCLFLISKVFVFDWVDSSQQVFQVILILTSFVLAWGEAWFLDCRVIPQERHARRYFSTLTDTTDRSPIMAPFLATQNERRPPDSVANFYSPLDSNLNSDDEDEQDEEYHQMGLNCVRKAYDLLQASDWRIEKVTKKGDTISSTQREKLGKIFKLTGRLKYPARLLCEELFYKIEGVPHWNPTILESKIIRKINSYTDITYQATVGGGGGMIKSRDFVNLRCWRLFQDGKICDVDINAESSDDDELLNSSYEGSVSTISGGGAAADDESSLNTLQQPSSVGSCKTDNNLTDNSNSFQTLSKSLGAKDFSEALRLNFNEPPPLDDKFDEFEDAKDHVEAEVKEPVSRAGIMTASKGRVWMNAAISIEYDKVPPTAKYTRGENIVAGFAMHEIEGKSDACVFEWILCLDLKGFIPRRVLDTAYTTFMCDYMTHLRKYCNEMRQRRRTVPRK